MLPSTQVHFFGKINLIYIDPPFFTGAAFSVKTKVGEKQIEKEPSIIEESKNIKKGGRKITAFLSPLKWACAS